MTTEVMTALLNRAANGNELLAVLDSLTEDSQQSDDNVPTLDVIDF